MTWQECSDQVLGFKHAKYKKYSNYDHAVRDFHAYFAGKTACELLPSPADGSHDPDLLPPPVAAPAPAVGKDACWKNVLIISLLVLVFGLWMKVRISGHI